MSESMKPKEEWLAGYSKKKTKRLYSANFDQFCEWAKTSDVKLVEEYKASDPKEFSKKWGNKIVAFYNHLLEKGLKINAARSKINGIRSFLSYQCTQPRIKRGAIARAQMSFGEHEFTLNELQRMYRVGDIQDKARLATAISLGWGAYDFVHLEWSFIEPHLADNLEPPVAFWYEREKTGAPSRSHLTLEAIDSLRTWKTVAPKSQYVFSGRNGNYLTDDALNDWLKSLVRRGKIETRGKIRFHLLRKFLMSQLSASGMNTWEAKLSVGKTIPSDILTYLKDQTQNLRQKFMNAESRFALSGITNSNHSRIEAMNEKVETLESIIQKQEIQIREQNLKIETLTKGLTRQNKEITYWMKQLAKHALSKEKLKEFKKLTEMNNTKH